MGRKRIKLPARGGKVRIKRQQRDGPESKETPRKKRPPTDEDSNGIEIPEDAVVNQMEDKAISQVRPGNADDVEMLYALTGRSRHRVHSFHSLASANVVNEATYERISYDRQQVIRYVNSELSYTPELFVLVHTHPRRSEPKPSGPDKSNWVDAGSTYRQAWEDVRVRFGIHAFTAEFDQPKSRFAPSRPSGDQTLVEWRSPTRDHAFRAYASDATGVQLRLV